MKCATAILLPVAFVVMLGVWGALSFYPCWRIGTLLVLAQSSSSSNTTFIVAGTVSIAILVSWLVAMAFPFGTRFRRSALVARAVSGVALTLFGLLVLLALECAVFEIVAACLPSVLAPGRNPLIAAAVLLGVCLCVGVASIANALHISVRRIRVASHKIAKPLRIAHISDVHIGSRGRSWLQRVVAVIENEHPDAVVITGDLFDVRSVSHADLAPLSTLRVPVLCSLGNHDLMCGQEAVAALFGELQGATLLHDGAYDLGDSCVVVGVGDCNKEVDMLLRLVAVRNKLDDARRQRFTILLHHRPHGFPNVAKDQLADLFLAGHTHAGQLFYFAPLVKLVFWRSVGLFRHHSNKDALLYVSPGTGTWGPLLRSSATCCVTIFDLMSATTATSSSSSDEDKIR